MSAHELDPHPQEELYQLREQLKHVKQEQEQERLRAEKAEQGAEQERLRAEKAKQGAEQERLRAEKAEQGAEQERLRAEKAEQATRSTTLIEYLEYCHTHLFQSISVETDKTLTTKGDVTNPEGKLHPVELRPWNNFIDVQKKTLERLRSVYKNYKTDEAFENLAVLEGLGNRIKGRKLTSETDLVILQRDTIEEPVRLILDHLGTINSVQYEFSNVSNKIRFDNHANDLSDESEEVSQRLRLRQSRPFTPNRSVNAQWAQQLPFPNRPVDALSSIRADQICVYDAPLDQGSIRKLAFVIEYKAAHKLTLATLRHGLREMNLQSVINRNPVPTSTISIETPNPEMPNSIIKKQIPNPEYFKYHADKLVASVVSQTFSYMIEGGSQYGYITTGEAFVFLYIHLEDPGTLYYHYVEPEKDVNAQKAAGQESWYRTAVFQVLAFTLLAVEADLGDQAWRDNAKSSLPTWAVDYDTILRSMEDSVRRSPPPSEYHPKTYTPAGEFEMNLRKRKRRCRPNTNIFGDDDDHNDDDDDRDSPDSSDLDNPPTPSPIANRKRGNQNLTRRPRDAGTYQQNTQSRSFCTQLCLYGLAKGGKLDPVCPNVSDHRGTKHEINKHQISSKTFLNDLREQLRLNRDRNCCPLGMQGARGAMFKVTLASYGYTVIAKGTVAAFVKDLQHECKVYQRLESLQGSCVPVCLGNIDLVHGYYYDFGVLIVHMMIMSWSGERLDKSKAWKDALDREMLITMATQSIQKIHLLGILHQDLRVPNILWDAKTSRIFLIDFERSKISDLRQPFTLNSPDRRKRRSLSDKVKKRNVYVVGSGFANELSTAITEFANLVS